MLLLHTIFTLALVFCCVIGIAFMTACTVLVITSMVRGDISIHIIGKTEKKEEK